MEAVQTAKFPKSELSRLGSGWIDLYTLISWNLFTLHTFEN